MKKVINGKKYDVSTATKVAHSWNGLSNDDFHHLSETLYRKKNGEFFLYGFGGPNTKYHRVYAGCATGGEDIMPMTLEQAKKWVEKFDNDSYEQIFGEVEE